ncbi:MAG: hypothetical protein R3Y58_07565 [Eubacteriales bacterium]
MAIFTTAGLGDSSNCYKTELDFYNLIDYCYRSCIAYESFYLYDLSMKAIADQMLYHQMCKKKVLNTRAIHYIMSFNRKEFGYDYEKQEKQVKRCLSMLNTQFFREYQHVFFLHNDKEGRFDIHMIINPVRVVDLKIYHCSPHEFKNMLELIGQYLYGYFGIALYGTNHVKVLDDGRKILCQGMSDEQWYHKNMDKIDARIKRMEDVCYPKGNG